MKRAWILTVFGDIHGFKKWQRSLVATPEIRRPVMEKYFKELELLAEIHPAQWKRRGDGFSMMLRLDSKNGRRQNKIALFLEDLRIFTARVLKVIKECEWPPEGFRVRVTGGWADEYEVKDLNYPGRKNGIEYISDLINLCEQLQHIKEEIPLICHKSIVILLGEKKMNKLGLRKINVNARDIFKTTRIFDPDDIKDLYEMPLKRRPYEPC